MVSASMAVQHVKWLQHAQDAPVAGRVSSLNVLLTSTCWRNDHNGFSHQGPGPDRLPHPAVTRGRAGVAAAGRQHDPVDHRPLPAQHRPRQPHRRRQAEAPAVPLPRGGATPLRGRVPGCGSGPAPAAPDEEPDIVLACAGDVPTQEALAAAELLAEHVPDLRVRFVNVVDLMALLPENDHPHGFTDSHFDELFTPDKHVVFAFHGYPRAVHQLDPRAQQPRSLPRPRLQRAGHDDDAVRHGRPQPDEPVPPRPGGAAPRERPASPAGTSWPTLCERRLAEHRPYIRGAPRGPARHHRLDVARRWPAAPTGGPVVSTRGHQHLHRRHRGAVRQVGGGRRAARPAGPARRPGRVSSGRSCAPARRDELVLTLLSQLPGDLPVEQACGRHRTTSCTPTPSGRWGRSSTGSTRSPAHHDVVLVVGSDFTDVPAPTEFSVNATVAANLGSRAAARGARPRATTPREVAATRGDGRRGRPRRARPRDRGRGQPGRTRTCSRRPQRACPSGSARARRRPCPRRRCCGRRRSGTSSTPATAALVHGDPALLDRECMGLVVAAMTMPHVLDRLVEGGVVIVPGDREDVVLGRAAGAPVHDLSRPCPASSSTAASRCRPRSSGSSTGSASCCR